MSLSPQKVDFEKTWAGLSTGIGKIITLSGVRGMPIIEDIYRLCTAQPQPYSEELYFRLKAFLENHVDNLCKELNNSQADFLSEFLRKWNQYSVGTSCCHNIFKYLNQNWIKKRLDDSRNKLGSFMSQGNGQEIYEVYTLALVIWRDRLFLKLKDRLIRGVLEIITKDRDGEQIDRSQVYNVVQSYVKLGEINKNKQLEIYREHFELAFLKNTVEYYARESSAYIAENGVSAYMKKAEVRLEEEQLRAKHFLDSSSYEKLKKECDSVLIDLHKGVLHSEVESMLREEKMEDLNRMFRLMSRIGEAGISAMLDILQAYVTNTGFEALKRVEKDAKDPKIYVETLLEVYEQFSEVVKRAFNGDSAFAAALDKACRAVVNENSLTKNTTKSPELLAKYCDLLLKKGNKVILEENQLEEKLNQIIGIFKYVDDKDVFQKFYSKMLARRLIQQNSVSDDSERLVISGLKAACGFEYTSKLQRMFTDMAVSSDINEKFKEYLQNHSLQLKVDFSILVLTTGSWPLQTQSSSFNVPAELENCVNFFQAYYNSQHQGRKLAWLHHLSKGDLRTNYLKKKYEFQVTNYQMAILLLFNSSDTLSVETLRNLTNLKDSELKRTIDSLVESKVLHQQGSEVTLNKTFSNKRLKLKLTGALQKETQTENSATHKAIDDDRKLYLQAAIVRIMKARKTLNHVNLVQEVIDQARIRFLPQIPMIKKCIEHLIEKEYLSRIEGENDKYQYVA